MVLSSTYLPVRNVPQNPLSSYMWKKFKQRQKVNNVGLTASNDSMLLELLSKGEFMKKL